MQRLALVVEDRPLDREAIVGTARRAGLGLDCRACSTAPAARLVLR